MGAVFAGAGRAPITAAVILFELTGEYTIILPLMLAVVCATAVSRALSPDTIYTLKLRRRGIDIDASRAPLPQLHLRQVMLDVPAPLRADDAFDIVRDRIRAAAGALPVVHEDGTYAGVLTLQVLEAAALSTQDGPPPRAGDLAVYPAAPHQDDDLQDAVRLMAGPDAAGGLPILGDGSCVVGWLDHASLIQALGSDRRR